MALYSVIKIFMNCFWGETYLSEEMESGTTKGVMAPIVCLSLLTILLGLGAEGISVYTELAVETLMSPELYIHAVFGGQTTP